MHAQSTLAPAQDSLTTIYDRDGYLSLESITTADDISQIRSLLDPLFDRFDTLGGRAVDLAGPYTPGVPARSPEISEPSVLAPALRETHAFTRCRALARELLGAPVGHLFDHAIYKRPHNSAATGWHQDQVYSQSLLPPRSVHFWIPLQAATVENGCMWYVPGSHRVGTIPHRVANLRTSASSSLSAGATLVVDDVDATKAIACSLPVGGVAIHHPLTLHYAGPNQTDDFRRAWILHFGAYGHWRSRLHPKNVAAKLRRVLGRSP